MGRLFALVSFMTAVAVGALVPARPRAQETSPLAGVWTLNRSLSEFPSDIGFNMSWAPTPGGDGRSAGSNAGGRGRRGSAGGGGNRGAAAPLPARPESYDDAQRAQLLTAEVRNPPVRLIVVNTPTAVIITNELGQSRTLHPDGKEESIEIQGTPIRVTSKRDGDRLVALYRVDQDRQMSYTYSYSASPSRLVIDVQFLEHGAAGDKARRVYEPGVGAETVPSVSAAAASAPATSRPPAPETLDKRPGADLRGLKSLGIVVEDLSAQAAVCGLSRDAIESKLSKQLTDGGFVVRKNSDEDTYVYVNVITTSLSNSLCVSRYDAFLYTSATAKLSYHDQPVLVQVSLMHRGGISGSAPTDHGPAVARGLENVIDLFVTQIHDANK